MDQRRIRLDPVGDSHPRVAVIRNGVWYRAGHWQRAGKRQCRQVDRSTGFFGVRLAMEDEHGQQQKDTAGP